MTSLDPSDRGDRDATRTDVAAIEADLSLERLFEEVATGIAVSDLEGRYRSVNPAFCRTVGYTADELRNLDFLTLTHPDDRAHNVELIESLLAGERDSFVLEKRYLPRHGEPVWVRATVSLLRAGDGAPSRLVATTEDISAQKVAEEQLAENERLMRIAGRVGRVGGWAVDGDRVLTWSDEVRQLLGYPRGRTPPLQEAVALIASGDRERVVDAIDACLVHGISFDLEVRTDTRDGQPLWVRLVGEPQRRTDGRIERVQGAFMDVSERKRAERESEELAERLTTTLESITDAFFTVDNDWRFTYLNRRAQQVLRRGADSLLGRRIWEEFPDLLDTEAEEAYRSALSEQRTRTLEEFYYPPLDSWFQVNAYPSEQGLAVYFRDVSAQRQARIALQEREARLEELAALLDEAQDAIIVRDLEGRVTFWNDSAERIFGWSAEEAMGRSVLELLGLDPEAYQAATEQLLAEGNWFGEVVKRAKDGREITLEARWTLVSDDAGRTDAVLQIDTDITERKRLEQQFLRAQRMESLGTLAGGVAHDLNNALLPVLVSAEMLREEVPDDSQQLLDVVEGGARHGSDLVQQLLSFARGVDGRRVPVSVAELVDEVGRISIDTFPKNITVAVDVPDDLPMVLGDPTQLRQVLINLCVNARDVLADGGTITLAGRTDVLEVLPGDGKGSPASGRYVTLCVADDGPGMSPETASKIFDPFFTTKAQGEGTGLGLSTSSAIIESHGGLVELDTHLGQGTTFKVHLPVDEAHDEEQDPPAEEPRRGSGELVLLVDDDQPVRDTTRLVLERHGYAVLEATDGARAVELIEERGEDVSVVLTDLMMPGLDGAETIARLRQRCPGLPVVAASGLVTTDATDGALRAGAQRVLLKPFTAETIAAAIGEAVATADTQRR